MTSPIPLPSRFNVAEHFLRTGLAAGRADTPCLVCGGDSLTRRELRKRSVRLALALRRGGVEPENRVILLMGESLAFPPSFWGTILAGAVAVPVNPALTPADHRRIIADSRAKALIVDRALWPGLAPHRREFRRLRHVIVSGGRLPGLPALDDLLEEAVDSGDEAPESAAEPTHPEDAAFWLYTSGSTGIPKAAIHLHRDPVFAVERYAKGVLGLGPDDVGLSAARMCFAYGLGNSILFPLATGGTAALLPDPPTGPSLLAALERHRPTVFYGVPVHFQAILEAQEGRWANGGIPRHAERPPWAASLRISVTAGEALPEQLARRWKERIGSHLLDGIGSSEMLTFFLSNRPGDIRPGTLGRAVPGFDLRLVDEGGRDVAEGEAGSLWVKGETAAARYWNRAELTRRTMRGEWLVTGDRMRRDPDGRYRYLGRDDDMFKVGGSWVSPVEVEEALMTHPAVAECAVVGIPGGDGLNRGKAFVVPAPGRLPPEGDSAALAAELRAHLSGNLAAFKIPHDVAFVPRLPRTPTGKLRRFQLRG